MSGPAEIIGTYLVLGVSIAVIPLMVLRALENYRHIRKQQTEQIEKAHPFYAVQHPETDELRAIYRQLDRELLIEDPDLLTPTGPPPAYTEAVKAEAAKYAAITLLNDGWYKYKSVTYSKSALQQKLAEEYPRRGTGAFLTQYGPRPSAGVQDELTYDQNVSRNELAQYVQNMDRKLKEVH